MGILQAIDEILPLIPDGEPLKSELTEWRETGNDSPEGRYKVFTILDRHFPAKDSDRTAWQSAVAARWYEHG